MLAQLNLNVTYVMQSAVLVRNAEMEKGFMEIEKNDPIKLNWDL